MVGMIKLHDNQFFINLTDVNYICENRIFYTFSNWENKSSCKRYFINKSVIFYDLNNCSYSEDICSFLVRDNNFLYGFWLIGYPSDVLNLIEVPSLFLNINIPLDITDKGFGV